MGGLHDIRTPNWVLLIRLYGSPGYLQYMFRWASVCKLLSGVPVKMPRWHQGLIKCGVWSPSVCYMPLVYKTETAVMPINICILWHVCFHSVVKYIFRKEKEHLWWSLFTEIRNEDQGIGEWLWIENDYFHIRLLPKFYGLLCLLKTKKKRKKVFSITPVRLYLTNVW